LDAVNVGFIILAAVMFSSVAIGYAAAIINQTITTANEALKQLPEISQNLLGQNNNASYVPQPLNQTQWVPYQP
jgi:ABC-type transport system involved in multi-copper enzyme maturation permease subunit